MKLFPQVFLIVHNSLICRLYGLWGEWGVYFDCKKGSNITTTYPQLLMWTDCGENGEPGLLALSSSPASEAESGGGEKWLQRN